MQFLDFSMLQFALSYVKTFVYKTFILAKIISKLFILLRSKSNQVNLKLLIKVLQHEEIGTLYVVGLNNFL